MNFSGPTFREIVLVVWASRVRAGAHSLALSHFQGNCFGSLGAVILSALKTMTYCLECEHRLKTVFSFSEL